MNFSQILRGNPAGVQSMQKMGWTLGKNWAYFVDKDAQHNEEAWTHRAPAMLMFFFR